MPYEIDAAKLNLPEQPTVHVGMGGPPPEPILQFFAWAHLPDHLAAVSEPFGTLARSIVATLPRNPERTVALRKLLEAKDAAVRAALYRD